MKILASFSGGKTSGYMTHLIHKNWGAEHEIVTLFANTGQEHEKTLEFVDNCDKYFGWNVVWIEAVIHEHGVGTSHKVVDYETASRNGEPFIEMCKQYGLPNMAYPHCTRELKLQPLKSYIKNVGFDDCYNAVGIRTDEERRRAKNAEKHKIIYPLIDEWPSDREDVNIFWEGMPFNLEIPSYLGNCKWCWKKSDNKHYRIIHEHPEFYDFPKMLDSTCSTCGNGRDIIDQGHRKMFRGHRDTDDMIKQAMLADYDVLKHIVDENEPSGCTSSCEAFQADLFESEK